VKVFPAVNDRLATVSDSFRSRARRAKPLEFMKRKNVTPRIDYHHWIGTCLAKTKQQKDEDPMKTLFNKCGDRELLWVMIGLFGLLVFSMNS
jgi:hypothetical protein